MDIKYFVIGYIERWDTFVAHDLTAEETHAFARDNDLNKFHRAPVSGSLYPEAKCNSSLRRPDKSYKRVTMQEWLDASYHCAKVYLRA